MDDKEFIKNNLKELLEIIATHKKSKLKEFSTHRAQHGQK